MLEFEHIVQVNDLENTSLIVLTRKQLWQGLVLRAQKPDKFIPGLQCTSEKMVDNQFLRTIEAGESSFCEQVSLFPEDKICTNTVANQQTKAQSIACIEEPETGSLFVRFSYRRDLEAQGDQIDVGEHLKAAYVQIDRDAISMIRMLAENKRFDETIN